MIKFEEEGHKYTSTDGSDIKWKSVTGIVHKFSNPFDADAQAIKSSRKKTSKWYGLSPSEILAEWKKTNEYSLTVGNWYHKMMEDSITSCDTIQENGIDIKIVKANVKEGIKYAPEQKLKNNHSYPEHFVYLKSVGLCGQSDDVTIIDNHVNILDFKTNKEFKLQSFRGWDGSYKMMLPPFAHLMDCHKDNYSLQLSLYMFMILKHNPQFKPGKITLQHVLFEEEDRDKFDNPIYKLDDKGNFIVKDTVTYEVPYLKAECLVIIDLLKNKKI